MPEYQQGDPWPRELPGAESAVPGMVCPCGSLCQEDDRAGHFCETCGAQFDDRGRRTIDPEYDVNEDGELVPTPYGDFQRDPFGDLLDELGEAMGIYKKTQTAVLAEVRALVEVRNAAGVTWPISVEPPSARERT